MASDETSESSPTDTSTPRRSRGTDAIYERPKDYDLEHEGDEADVRFYVDLARRLRPQRVLELAAGSGRVTMPLARAGASHQFDVVGLELAETMLAEAERKRMELPEAAQRRVTFVRGDLRTWAADQPFDLIVTPCSSMAHLHDLDDQIAAWRRAYDNLVRGGRLVVDLAVPNLTVYADSMCSPPRIALEVDVDTTDPDTGERLIRYKTTRYVAHAQRAEIRFLYDKLTNNAVVDRYVSDFDAHVYYPREVELLFKLTGFEVENRWGDYRMRPLTNASREMIVVGIRR